MRFAKLILGLIAAVGVARLLAPKETQNVVESARRAMANGLDGMRRQPLMAEAGDIYAAATGKTKSASRSMPRKTSAGSRTRKAASRRTRG